MYLGILLEDYCRKIIGFIKTSGLSDTLISSILSNIDIIDYHTLAVIRIKIPAQKEMSYLDDEVYERQFSDTVKISSPKIQDDSGDFQKISILEGGNILVTENQ